MGGYGEVDTDGFGSVSNGGVFGFSLVCWEFARRGGGFVGLQGFEHLVDEAFDVLKRER